MLLSLTCKLTTRPETFPSNFLSLSWATIPNSLNIQSFLGGSQNSGGKNASQTEGCILSSRTLCRSRGSGLVEGPLSATSAQETFGKKNSPALGIVCFLPIFSRNVTVFVVWHPSFFLQVDINQATGAYSGCGVISIVSPINFPFYD